MSIDEDILPFEPNDEPPSVESLAMRAVDGDLRWIILFPQHPRLFLPDQQYTEAAGPVGGPVPVLQHVLGINLQCGQEGILTIPGSRYFSTDRNVRDIQQFTRKELLEEWQQLLAMARMNGNLFVNALNFQAEVKKLLGNIFIG